jgi:hypothetical protein
MMLDFVNTLAIGLSRENWHGLTCRCAMSRGQWVQKNTTRLSACGQNAVQCSIWVTAALANRLLYTVLAFRHALCRQHIPQTLLSHCAHFIPVIWLHFALSLCIIVLVACFVGIPSEWTIFTSVSTPPSSFVFLTAPWWLRGRRSLGRHSPSWQKPSNSRASLQDQKCFDGSGHSSCCRKM